MKKITIIGADEAISSVCLLSAKKQDYEISGDKEMSVCDGYHTFDELYEHRITLFIALCRAFYNDPQYQTGQKAQIWRSKLHSDGSSFNGWFILGIGKEKGKQITYHLPLSKLEETSFAEDLEKAPEWDGHTSNDVLERIKNL